MPKLADPELAGIATRPLCVDLDGTLVKSDTLIDSLLVLARSRPRLLLKLPSKLLEGKAAFKAFIAESIKLDVAHLPYNRKLLAYLEDQHNQGRAIYLTTGSNIALARRVAENLGIFKGVLASDNKVNLTGNHKLDSLRAELGPGNFDYVGNGVPDLPLLANATEPMVANPSFALRSLLRSRKVQLAQDFSDRKHPFAVLVRAMRPHQWAKNVLLLVPLLLSHRAGVTSLAIGVLAFLSFSLVASGTYLVNDMLDIETDRHHHKKRDRPFAAGDLSPVVGVIVSAALVLIAFVLAHQLPREFNGWLLLYAAMTLSYSTWLKRVPIVDVMLLSGLYTLRLLAGGAATATHISHWLAGFSVFLFLSLAIAKRFAELHNLASKNSVPRNGRGYLLDDIEQLRAFGTASAFAAVVIFANYISGVDVTALYRHPTILWLIVPLMIFWLCRVWLLASRGELHEDPVVFALTDPMSLLIGAATGLAAVLAI